MKKITSQAIIGTSIVVLLFLAYNTSEMLSMYYNVTGNYEAANNLEGFYNGATHHYKNGNFQFGEEIFMSYSGTLEKSHLGFRYLHNRGNTLYKMGKLEVDKQKKLSLYQQSRSYYSDALDEDSDLETQKSLEFLEYMIKKLQREIEKEKSTDEDNTGGESGEEKESNEPGEFGKKGEEQERAEEEGEDGESGEEGHKSEEQSAGEGQDESNQEQPGEGASKEGLSEETKEALEKHAEELQKQQSQIGKYYNKNYKESRDPLDDFNNFFGHNPSFDNSALGSKEGKKDW